MARGKGGARVGPEDAGNAAYVNISTSHNSTQAVIIELRLCADGFQDPRFDTLADRYAGIGPRPGTKPTDDSRSLQRIRELWPVYGSNTVGCVAREVYPGDELAQEAASHRWRRKLKAEGFDPKEKRTS
jgi:hypothetical protein